MRYRLALLPIMLWAGPAGAAFHPVEDRRYRFATIETRTADGGTRRFSATRSIVFHRTASGYDATVTLEAVDQQPAGDVSRMFLIATGALLHHPLRYHLDATGAILAVEDSDDAIALIAAAIERMGVSTQRRSDHSRTLASPLRTLTPDRKAAMLRSILLPVLAGLAADRPSGQASVLVPSRPPLPPGTRIAGTETVSRGAHGIITIHTSAQGMIDATPPEGLSGAEIAKRGAPPTATLHTIRNVDPATGLLHDSRETSELTMSDGQASDRTTIETVATLELELK